VSSERDPARDRGMATVTALVLIFATMTGALVWLAVDVNDRVAARSTAQSIAFQAARAGAQQVAGLRTLDPGAVMLRPEAAVDAARHTATELIGTYRVHPAPAERAVWFEATVAAHGRRLTVTVRLLGGDGRIVTGVGAAEPATAVSTAVGATP